MRDMQKMIAEAQAAAEADRKARTVTVLAADLLQEFQQDPEAADRKYQGKYLEIFGVVERVGEDGNGTPFVILHAGEASVPLQIECFFDDGFLDQRPAKGRAVTLAGEYRGRVSHIQIRECTLMR
jgi:hypothetical protein